jgi:hypothetical protein
LTFPDDVEALVVPVSYGWGVEDSEVKFEQKGKVERFMRKLRQRGERCRRWSTRSISPDGMVSL